jgi:ATP-dependent metalloprotease FtsH
MQILDFVKSRKRLVFVLIFLLICYDNIYGGIFLASITETTLGQLREVIVSNPNTIAFKKIDVYDDNGMAYFHLANNTIKSLTFSKSANLHEIFTDLLGKNNNVPMHYIHGNSVIMGIVYMITSNIMPVISQIAICAIILFLVLWIVGMAVGGDAKKTKDTNFFSIIKDNPTRFDDIIGQTNGKRELMECVNFFKHREKYVKINYKIPKGILLVGPPGTGKTLMARAFAGECKTSFIYVSGSDFEEMFVGVGSRRIRELFEYARKNKPTVIFIDEIDSIGGKRGDKNSMTAGERVATLNKLLTELDGFSVNDDLIVLGATNRPEILDEALLRAGRFDKEIIFDHPNKDERVDLFKLYMGKVKVSEEFKKDAEENYKKLAKRVAGMTGADIANIVNQSVRNFTRRYNLDLDFPEDSGVTMEDMYIAIDDVAVGEEKKERKMSDTELDIVSYHEAGHALMAYLLNDAEHPIKISIIPRGRSALGYTQSEPTDQKIYTEKQLSARLCVLLGGRNSEQIVFSHISTGASDDIEKITKLATTMVQKYGMSGVPLSYSSKNISEYTKKSIDNSIRYLIRDAENFTTMCLTQKRVYLDIVSNFLRTNEQITDDELEELLGKTGIKNSMSPNFKCTINFL